MQKNIKNKPIKNIKSATKKRIDKNQILAYILAFLIIFWTVSSVFSFIAYARTKPQASINKITASAYESDLPLSDVIVNGNINQTYISAFNVPSYSFDLGAMTGFILTTFDPNIGGDGTGAGSYSHAGEILLDTFKIDMIDGSAEVLYDDNTISSSDDFEMYVFDDVQSSLSPSVITCSIFYDYEFQYLPADVNASYVNCEGAYFYYDQINADAENPFGYLSLHYGLEFSHYSLSGVEVNSNNFEITVECPYFLGSNQLYSSYLNQLLDEDYIYFFPATIVSSYGAGANYFQIQYQKYLVDVAEDRYDTAYADGKRAGETIGFNNGYNAGRESVLGENGVYTFDGLLSAIIDVPVRTFTSLFNFEILGVNLSAFILSILTLAVVLTVVRMLL